MNIRYVKPADIPVKADFAAIDVSFISLTKVLPAVRELLKADAGIVMLVKPQFEAGRDKVGKHGVIKDAGIHNDVLLKITDYLFNSGYIAIDISYSPLKGPEGNIEFLVHCKIGGKTAKSPDMMDFKKMIRDIVRKAHEELSDSGNQSRTTV
jgi:23S rRNA (cytidine1920-2'-O)/16S rRNA (cytidine1409-2'-O)-methyltransferase